MDNVGPIILTHVLKGNVAFFSKVFLKNKEGVFRIVRQFLKWITPKISHYVPTLPVVPYLTINPKGRIYMQNLKRGFFSPTAAQDGPSEALGNT